MAEVAQQLGLKIIITTGCCHQGKHQKPKDNPAERQDRRSSPSHNSLQVIPCTLHICGHFSWLTSAKGETEVVGESGEQGQDKPPGPLFCAIHVVRRNT